MFAPLRRLALLLPVAMTACAAPRTMPYEVQEVRRLPPPEQAPPASPYPAEARGDRLLIGAMLAGHNGERARYGLAALTWDAALASAAESYARQMAASGVLRHDTTPGRRKTMGENLFRGTKGAYRYDAMVGFWLAERRYFRPGIFPNVTTSGNWADVGHYTQMIWPTTTRVGCGVASNARHDYLVCRYSPPGNKDGGRVG